MHITYSKYFLTCLLFVLIVIFSADCGISPTNAPTIDSPPKPDPAVKSLGRVSIRFDKNKNILEVRGGTKLFGEVGKEEGIGLSAWFTSPDQKVAQPQFVTFTLFTACKDRTYVDDLTFKVWANDTLIIDSASKLGGTKSDFYYIHAVFDKEIPYRDLVTISQAQKIKMQVGPTQFDVNESDLNLFRDLLKAVGR